MSLNTKSKIWLGLIMKCLLKIKKILNSPQGKQAFLILNSNKNRKTTLKRKKKFLLLKSSNLISRSSNHLQKEFKF